MVDYGKEIEKIIKELKNEDPNREIEFKEGYILDINRIKVEVSILEIKEPIEKDDEKTNINKMQVLFKTKEGYTLIAEVTEDNEIDIKREGIEKAGIDKRILTQSNKIGLKKAEEEEGNQEKADQEKPEINKDKDKEEVSEDKKKKEIAEMYNTDPRNVIHIAMDKKLTDDYRFENFVKSAEGYTDLYIVRMEDNYTWSLIGEKDGELEEISNSKNEWGKNPDMTIKVEENGIIKEVRPLAVITMDSETTLAMTRDESGKHQAIYCRQTEGNKKEFWGIIVPEAEGKNVKQGTPEQRDAVGKGNSKNDLSKMADYAKYLENLIERGLPSREEGVQTYEVNGTKEQNREKILEDIARDLYKKQDLADKIGYAMPGYAEYKRKQLDKFAEKILDLMEKDDKLTYEDAVGIVEERNRREEGGITPDEKRSRDM